LPAERDKTEKTFFWGGLVDDAADETMAKAADDMKLKDGSD